MAIQHTCRGDDAFPNETIPPDTTSPISVVEVSPTDYTRFWSLERRQKQLQTALQLFRKQKTGGSDEEN